MTTFAFIYEKSFAGQCLNCMVHPSTKIITLMKIGRNKPKTETNYKPKTTYLRVNVLFPNKPTH